MITTLEAKPNPIGTILLPALIVVSGVAVSAYIGWRKYQASKEQGTEAGGSVSGDVVPVPGIPGVFMKRGVVLTDAMTNFLPEIRSRLNFDLSVTSGLRYPSEQAKLMMETPGGIMSLYRGAAGAEAAAVESQGAAAVQRVIENQVTRGVYVSRHLRGDALDFRTRDLSAAQVAALRLAGLSLGVEVLDEGDHIHMEELGSVISTVTQTAQKTFPYMIAVSTVIAAGVLGYAWYSSRKTA